MKRAHSDSLGATQGQISCNCRLYFCLSFGFTLNCKRMCSIWIITRIITWTFFESKWTLEFHKEAKWQSIYMCTYKHHSACYKVLFLPNGQLYSVTYILSMNLWCPSSFVLFHHEGNKIISHQRRTLFREEITQALNQSQVEQEGLVLLYCLII